MVHRLVAQKFIVNEHDIKLEVNHMDFNGKNNKISNLEWCSPRENMAHASGRAIQITKDSFYAKFNSVREAARFLHIDPTDIRSCIREKKKTASGYEVKDYQD